MPIIIISLILCCKLDTNSRNQKKNKLYSNILNFENDIPYSNFIET